MIQMLKSIFGKKSNGLSDLCIPSSNQNVVGDEPISLPMHTERLEYNQRTKEVNNKVPYSEIVNNVANTPNNSPSKSQPKVRVNGVDFVRSDNGSWEADARNMKSTSPGRPALKIKGRMRE